MINRDSLMVCQFCGFNLFTETSAGTPIVSDEFCWYCRHLIEEWQAAVIFERHPMRDEREQLPPFRPSPSVNPIGAKS